MGLPIYVPYFKGGTGSILGSGTTSIKTQSQGREGMSGEGTEVWVAGGSVSGGTGGKMAVVGWD